MFELWARVSELTTLPGYYIDYHAPDVLEQKPAVEGQGRTQVYTC